MDRKDIELLNYYRNKIPKFQGRRYFDYPDGEDLLGKLICTNRIAGLLGLTIGSLRCLSNPPVKGFLSKLFVISRYTVPLIGAASAYTLTAYHATDIRKVDEPSNHFLAGAAAGIVIASTVGKFHITNAIICGMIGYGFKTSVMLGQHILIPYDSNIATYPSYVRRMKSRFRNTTTEYEPRTWTREKPEEITI